jgi:adenine-specific DNA-methyltransferase
MQLNSEDGGNRQFICVQIPEKTLETSEAFKAGYKNIAEISKERIRRAGAKIKMDSAITLRSTQNDENVENRHPARSRRVYDDGKAEFTGDTGFKVFKLDTSNLKRWDASFETIETDLINAVDYIKSDRRDDDLLYELLIKFGLDLSVPIEKRTILNRQIYIIGGALVVCLDENISLELVDYIGTLKAELNPETSMRVVFRDHSFIDDSVKTNTMQILKRYGITDVKSL